jgi:putative transposase
MSKPPRIGPAGIFFITTNCWNRRRLFQVDHHAQLLLDTILKHREHFALHAYVIMPDHVHILMTPREIPLERIMQLIKGGFSHAFAKSSNDKSEVWQRGFSDHRIRDHADFDKHVTYTHDNPIAAHLAATPQEFQWSSARNLVPMDGYRAS